jgi:hypothetical protein
MYFARNSKCSVGCSQEAKQRNTNVFDIVGTTLARQLNQVHEETLTFVRFNFFQGCYQMTRIQSTCKTIHGMVLQVNYPSPTTKIKLANSVYALRSDNCTRNTVQDKSKC